MWKCSNRFGTSLTREDTESMFKIQWVRDDAFGWPFSWGRSAQNRGGSPTRLFHLGFSDDCRLMWCRYDGISIWVSLYVEPSHAIFVTLCLLADSSHLNMSLPAFVDSCCTQPFFCQIISRSLVLFFPYLTHFQITIDRYLDGLEHVNVNTCETNPAHLQHGFVAKWGAHPKLPITLKQN